MRDGLAALKLAEHCCLATEFAHVNYLDTLAAALAESGDFPKAVRLASAARQQAANDPARTVEIDQRLQLYSAGKPFRENRNAQVALAGKLLQRGAYDEAKRHLTAVLNRRADDPEAQLLMAVAQRRSGNLPAAVDAFRAVVRLRPDWHDAANELAWLLATQSDPSLRDATTALTVAESLCRATEYRQANYVDTLAAAYAAAGRFDDAVTTIDQALTLLPPDENDALRRAMLGRKQRYEAGQPYWVAAGADR